jgi:lysophospholipase L1-like esterase
MKFTLHWRAILGVSLLVAAGRLMAGDLLIHDGDRVVFLGDSITEQKLYTTYVEGYVLTRHPEWKLTFRNVGWGGDTSWLRQRAHPDEGKLFAANDADQQKMVEGSVAGGLKRDVLPLKPTFVTIKFGMNDHAYQAFREDIFRAYVKSQAELGKVLQTSGARVAYLTPQPIEQIRVDPDKDVNNMSLRQFSDGLKGVATARKATFVDQFDPYMAIMLNARKTDPKARIGEGDAVHPGPCGHTIMAWAVLKGLGADAPVSTATMDVASKQTTASTGCKIDKLVFSNGTIAFTRLDEALPMPIDSRAEHALGLAPILDELSRYELRVTGLTSGNYELFIDGESAMKTTGEALAKGVNLTVNAGPITRQSRELLAHVFTKNELYFQRWRYVELYDFPDWARGKDVEARRAAKLKELDKQIAGEESVINKLRKPVSHQFEIKPI